MCKGGNTEHAQVVSGHSRSMGSGRPSSPQVNGESRIEEVCVQAAREDIRGAGSPADAPFYSTRRQGPTLPPTIYPPLELSLTNV